jgi:hypothetical protein
MLRGSRGQAAESTVGDAARVRILAAAERSIGVRAPRNKLRLTTDVAGLDDPVN